MSIKLSHDDVKYSVSWAHDASKGHSECWVTRGEPGTPTCDHWYGDSQCNLRDDAWSRETGRRISLTRALQAMSDGIAFDVVARAVRTAIWTAYRGRAKHSAYTGHIKTGRGGIS